MMETIWWMVMVSVRERENTFLLENIGACELDLLQSTDLQDRRGRRSRSRRQEHQEDRLHPASVPMFLEQLSAAPRHCCTPELSAKQKPADPS